MLSVSIGVGGWTEVEDGYGVRYTATDLGCVATAAGVVAIGMEGGVAFAEGWESERDGW